jgi:hypothetical protein
MEYKTISNVLFLNGKKLCATLTAGLPALGMAGRFVVKPK